MEVQVRTDLDTRPFILESLPSCKRLDKAVILTDGGRSTPLLSRTLMAKISATEKWVPYTDPAATDGTAKPAGIYDPEGHLGDISAADIVAGDVVDVPIIIFGALFDDSKLVIENSLTLDTVISTGTIEEQTVADALRKISLIPQSAISGSQPENPAV